MSTHEVFSDQPKLVRPASVEEFCLGLVALTDVTETHDFALEWQPIFDRFSTGTASLHLSFEYIERIDPSEESRLWLAKRRLNGDKFGRMLSAFDSIVTDHDQRFPEAHMHEYVAAIAAGGLALPQFSRKDSEKTVRNMMLGTAAHRENLATPGFIFRNPDYHYGTQPGDRSRAKTVQRVTREHFKALKSAQKSK